MDIQASVTISCQKCGGVAKTVAGQEYHRCSFCGSLIQLAEVSVDRILPTGTELDSDCPTCTQPLQTGSIEGRRALYCASCFGVLIRHEDFGGIVHARQARRTGIEPAEPRPIDPAAFERHLNCPSCHQKMDVHPYYGPGNIVVDTCVGCGFVWLDHGELSRVEQSSYARTPQFDWHQNDQGDTHSQRTAPFDSEPDAVEHSPLRILADLLF